MDIWAQLRSLAAVNPADLGLSVNETFQLIVIWGICLIIILDVWWLLPKLCQRFCRWWDARIPVPIGDYQKGLAWFLTSLITVAALAGGTIATAAALGYNVDWAKGAASEVGVAIAAWLGPRIARIAVIMIIGALLMRGASRVIPPLLKQYLSRRAGANAVAGEAEKRERTLIGVVTRSVNVLIIVLVGFVILSEMGVNLAPLLAAAGVIGIAVGFGAQSLVRDIFSGIFILLEDQYRVGDVVQVADMSGLVEDINLRRTVLRDLDFIVHVIPNGEVRIASNFTKEKSRVNLNIRVAYKEDLDKVITVLNRVGEELSQDEYFGPLVREPIKVLRVDDFQESAVAIKVIGETLPIRQWEVAGEYRRRVKRAFDDEGITIPFPHRTVYWGAGVETRVRQLVEEAKLGEGEDSRELEPSRPQS